MKKTYVAPEFEAVNFSKEDVLTASGNCHIDIPDLDIDIDVDIDPSVDIKIKLRVIEWFKEHWHGINP